MSRDAILTLDVGTTSCRAIAFDVAGRVLAREEEEYPLLRPHPGWVEQDPRTLLAASRKAVHMVVGALGAERVAALCVSTYLHSLLALDEAGSPLSSIILWNDTRSAEEADELRASEPELYERTGCPPHTMYCLPKLLWLRKHQPELWQRVVRWGSIKDVLLERFTGEWVVDHSVASGSGFLDLRRVEWDTRALEIAGISRDYLPELVPTTALLKVSRAGADLTGLQEGTPVVAGAGDGVLSNLGAGAIRPGVVAVMVGTSGAVRVGSPGVLTDAQGRTFCYNLAPGHWIVGGAISNGGIVLKWLRDGWHNQWSAGAPSAEWSAGAPSAERRATYEDITAAAEAVPPGAGALLFMPLLTGERAPHWNSRARGAMIGLGLEHGPAHMYRAALEGITYSLNAVREALAEVTGPAKEMRATGGLSRSQLWVQMCADVFGQQVSVTGESEGSALGAFLLARHALGDEPDLPAAAERVVTIERTYTPKPEPQRAYTELYKVYQDSYKSLEATFAALAQLRAAP